MTDTHTTPLVRTEHLGKIYPDGQVNALTDVNLSIPQGQYVALLGPSGCGKSTLLNLLGGLDTPTTGEVYWGGEPLSKLRDVDRFRAAQDRFCLSILPAAADVVGGGERASADVPGSSEGGGASQAGP